jgi:hypothetical protein
MFIIRQYNKNRRKSQEYFQLHRVMIIDENQKKTYN